MERAVLNRSLADCTCADAQLNIKQCCVLPFSVNSGNRKRERVTNKKSEQDCEELYLEAALPCTVWVCNKSVVPS